MTDYLDTSVLTAYYCPEPRSDRVQRLLLRTTEPAISPLMEVEFFSAVARKARRGDLDADAARQVLSQFRRHLEEARYLVVALTTSEFRTARDWLGLLATPLRALDAMHLAVTFAHEMRLVTADRDLADAAKRLGVRRKLIA